MFQNLFWPGVKHDLLLMVLAGLMLIAPRAALSAELNAATDRELRLVVFTRNDVEECRAAVKFVEELAKRRPGIRIDVRDVLADDKALAEFWRLAKLQKNTEPGLPAFWALDRFEMGFTDAATSGATIESLFDVDIFSRTNCPHCQDAKKFLAGLEQRWPGIRVRNHDLNNDPNARTEMAAAARRGGINPQFVPVIAVGSKVLMGYTSDSVTGREIEGVLEKGEAPQRLPAANKTSRRERSPGASAFTVVGVLPQVGWLALLAAVDDTVPQTSEDTSSKSAPAGKLAPPPPAKVAAPPSAKLTPPPPPKLAVPPPPATTEPPANEPNSETSSTAATTVEPTPDASTAPLGIEVPGLGFIRLADWGLPLFTLIIGLVDGFNPCAMWVLVFLLSVLVNVHDRWRMLAIAGTFVLISGLAYFAFMAAWLNMFLLLDMERPLQIVLGIVAAFIGLINIKDFFAFKQGISLSIPESAKPGIYERVRKIVAAKYLSVALGLSVVLAIGVNMVELLCTAGLPALYTQILTAHELPAWKNYAYLGLYNLGYMFDDAVLLVTFVITLSRHKLQENEGKWLKLLSGAVVLGLGLTMIFRPDLLHWRLTSG